MEKDYSKLALETFPIIYWVRNSINQKTIVNGYVTKFVGYYLYQSNYITNYDDYDDEDDNDDDDDDDDRNCY